VGGPGTVRSTPFPRIVGYFRRHPVLLLLCFSPGLPEYLSGSSSLALLALNPIVFFLFLGLNLGLYGPGVLLVREALLRWGKGWAALLCLGTAYAFLEEGTALSTMFNPNASVVGGLGHYGHAGGVNWVWMIGVIQVHIVLSIGLPILLLGLALPETRGQRFLTPSRTAVVVAIFAVDIALLALISHYYPVGGAWQLAAVGVALALAALAYRLPRDLLNPTSERPRWGRWAFYMLGLLWFPNIVLVPGIGEHTALGAPLVGALEIATSALLFFAVRHSVGRTQNAPQLIFLALGILTPIVLFGFASQLELPVFVLIADVLAILFFYSLWRRYRPIEEPVRPAVPAGAT
jgi:hypothetical protein